MTKKGTRKAPLFPFQITLRPTDVVKFREEDSDILAFMKQFIDKIPEATELYSFMALANPDDIDDFELAKLVVVDRCYTSKYGDEKLFFQLQKIEEHIELKPESESAYKTECT